MVAEAIAPIVAHTFLLAAPRVTNRVLVANEPKTDISLKARLDNSYTSDPVVYWQYVLQHEQADSREKGRSRPQYDRRGAETAPLQCGQFH